MGFFGSGGGGGLGGGFLGGATNIVGGLFGGGGGGGNGLGGQGGQLQQLGVLGGGGNGNAFGMPDPLDIMGNRDKAQQKAAQDLYNQQSEKIAQMMKDRPGYMDIQNADGTLDSRYKMQAASAGSAKTGSAYTTDTGELDKRMNLAQDVSADGVVGKYGEVAASTSAQQADINAGKQALNASSDLDRIRTDAFSTAPSAWAGAANSQADNQRRSALDRMGLDAATSKAQQENDLAMTGGLEGGARERIGKNAARNQMMGNQGIYNQDSQTRNSIAMQDAMTKQQTQMQLPGMGLQVDAYSTGLANQNANRNQQNNQFNAGQTQAASTINVGNSLAAHQFDSSSKLAADQYNSQLDMQRASAYQGAAQYNASNQQQNSQYNAGQQNNMSQYNAGLQQQANGMNNQNLIGDVRGQNAFAQDQWNTGMQAQAAQNVAQQQINSMPQGGFFSKILGGANI